MTDDFENKFDKTKKNWLVYQVLKDQQWHCRECEYFHVSSSQIAGGGGIQGLERGTKSRPGMIISSADHFCSNCTKTTRHDRWQGGFQSSVQGSSMSKAFSKRVIDLFGNRDIVEGTERPYNQLTIDHKLPMLRWNDITKKEQIDYINMTDDDIRSNFQLLKKSNGSVSHNLLKSRTCEQCYKHGKRGTPFGIKFFYCGGANWEPEDKKDARGCVGCGWFDFDKWRKELNKTINNL